MSKQQQKSKKSNGRVSAPQSSTPVKRPIDLSVKSREVSAIRLAARASGKAQGSKKIEVAIAESLALPGEQGTRPFRWASEFSTAKTALAHPSQILVPSFGAGINPYPQVGLLEQVTFLSRQYMRSMIMYDQNNGTVSADYSVRYRGGGGGIPSTTATYAIDNGSSTNIQSPYAVGVTPAYMPHGPVLFAGTVKANPAGRFFWLDLGTSYDVTITSSVTGNCDLQCDYYGPNGFTQNYISVNIPLVAGIPLLTTIKALGGAGGYYSLRLKNNTTLDNVNFDVSGTIKIRGSVFCHLSTPNLWDNIASVRGIRILGASLKYTNTAAFNSKDGKVVARQVGSSENWQNYYSSDSWALVAKQTDYKDFAADNGMYGFLKSTSPDDFNLKMYHSVNLAGVLNDCFYPIDDDPAFIVMVIRVNTQAAASAAISQRLGVEFATTSTWFDTANSSVPADSYAKALTLMRDIDQFHENPLHFDEIVKKIGSTISSIASNVLKFLPYVGEIASILL
jgi:hypothetical protein